jgi:hypothetical protein
MLVLKLKPSFNKENKFHIEAYSDSDFAGDRETRASVYGFVFVCGAPISWKSKSSKNVTLYSTEGGYIAASETSNEVMVIKNIIERINELPHLQLPMTLRIDNTGAIYLGNNRTTGQRNKHIDIRFHYVRDLITADIIRTKFVKTDDNTTDIFTKKTSETLFVKHTDKLIDDVEDIYAKTFIGFEYSDDDNNDEYEF